MQIGGFFYQPCRKLREPMVQVVAASPITYLNDFLAYYDCCDVQNCFVYYAKNMRSYIHICKKMRRGNTQAHFIHCTLGPTVIGQRTLSKSAMLVLPQLLKLRVLNKASLFEMQSAAAAPWSKPLLSSLRSISC